MSEPLLLAIVLAAGIVAGVINTLAGGGSLLTLPILVLLVGLPAPIANGTNRIAVLVQSLAAAVAFRRSKVGGTPLALRVAPVICAGSVAGAYLATRVSAVPLQRVMGAVLLACLPLVIFAHRLTGAASRSPRKVHVVVVVVLAALIGLYSGFLQAVVGIPILLLLVWGLGIDVVEASNIKVIIIAASMAAALVVFASAGQVHLLYGLTSAAGQAIGAWIGARLVVRKGLAVVRWAMALAVGAAALEMLGVLR